ncbi:MAG: hypothetical protein ACYDCL_15400 [Myxococcales bacterium]
MSRPFAGLLCLATACCGPSGGVDAGADGGRCPSVSPACDAGTSPSYRSQVEPILERSCLPCHTPGQQPYAGFDLSSYGAVDAIHQTVLEQLYICAMPNGDGGPGFALDGGSLTLSPADRLTVIDWCCSGAPDN